MPKTTMVVDGNNNAKGEEQPQRDIIKHSKDEDEENRLAKSLIDYGKYL